MGAVTIAEWNVRPSDPPATGAGERPQALLRKWANVLDIPSGTFVNDDLRAAADHIDHVEAQAWKYLQEAGRLTAQPAPAEAVPVAWLDMQTGGLTTVNPQLAANPPKGLWTPLYALPVDGATRGTARIVESVSEMASRVGAEFVPDSNKIAAFEKAHAVTREPTITLPAKPIGWFNPWNDYHGFQQVADEFAGGEGTIPLYAPQNIHDDLARASTPATDGKP